MITRAVIFFRIAITTLSLSTTAASSSSHVSSSRRWLVASESMTVKRHSYSLQTSSVLNVSIRLFIRIIQCRFHFPPLPPPIPLRNTIRSPACTRRHAQLITSLSGKWLSPFLWWISFLKTFNFSLPKA